MGWWTLDIVGWGGILFHYPTTHNPCHPPLLSLVSCLLSPAPHTMPVNDWTKYAFNPSKIERFSVFRSLRGVYPEFGEFGATGWKRLFRIAIWRIRRFMAPT